MRKNRRVSAPHLLTARERLGVIWTAEVGLQVREIERRALHAARGGRG